VGACLCPFTTAAAQCRARAPEPIPWVTPRFEPAVLSVKKLAVRTTSAVLSTWYQARAWRLWPSRLFRRTTTPCRLSCSSATSNVLAPPAVGTTIQAWPRNRRQHRPRGGSDGAIMAPHDGMLPSPSMASSRPNRFNGGVPQPHRAKRAVALAADVRGGRPPSVRYRRHCVVPVRSNLAGSTPDQSEWGTQLTCIAGWFDKYMMSGFLEIALPVIISQPPPSRRQNVRPQAAQKKPSVRPRIDEAGHVVPADDGQTAATPPASFLHNRSVDRHPSAASPNSLHALDTRQAPEGTCQRVLARAHPGLARVAGGARGR